jgi:ribosome maturation factor RimP
MVNDEWAFKEPTSFMPFGGESLSKRESIEQRTEEILAPIAEKNGVEIYDVEYVKEAGENYLRAYIDKEGGVTIDDCEAVSRILSDELDKADYIQDGYILEVSSPGLGRTLKKDRHLIKSIGEEVEIKTYKPIEKVKEFVGILDSFDEKSITIIENGNPRTFRREEIAKISLTFDF